MTTGGQKASCGCHYTAVGPMYSLAVNSSKDFHQDHIKMQTSSSITGDMLKNRAMQIPKKKKKKTKKPQNGSISISGKTDLGHSCNRKCAHSWLKTVWKSSRATSKQRVSCIFYGRSIIIPNLSTDGARQSVS